MDKTKLKGVSHSDLNPYDLTNIQHINQVDRDFALKIYDELITKNNNSLYKTKARFK